MPIARSRLSPCHLTRATTLGTIYEPEQAVGVGYLDLIVPAAQLETRAVEEAAKLASLGKQGANGPFHTTKLYERREVLEVAKSRLAVDVAQFRA